MNTAACLSSYVSGYGVDSRALFSRVNNSVGFSSWVTSNLDPGKLGEDAVLWYVGAWLDINLDVSGEEHKANDCNSLADVLEYKARNEP